MTYIITTESGSIYEIDTDLMTWIRLQMSKQSGYIRSKSGTFLELKTLGIGKRMTIVCPPFIEGMSGRLIITSPLTKIEEKPKAVCQ
jgi:hypothetical protein